MPLQTYYMTQDGNIQRDLTEEDIIKAYKSKQGLLWVDISETTEEDGRLLEQGIGFHHLAVEDCLSTQIHSPKIDDFREYIFIIVHGVNHVTESDIVETTEMDIFLGPNFVVSNHKTPLYCVNAVQHIIEEDAELMNRGSDFLAHAIIDTFADNVMPTIDRMTDVAEIIEEEVIKQPHPATLEGIMKLKRSTMKVHRIMSPQREVLNRLSRGEFPLIKPNAQIFYRDIYDHVVRIEDLNQTIRDRADNALSTYLSAVANRQNETMRVLSIVATIFMPLTLLVGIYGMNFVYMPELGFRWGYFIILGIIFFVALILIWRFWASGWFARGRRKMSWIKPFAVNGKHIRGFQHHEKHDHD